MSGILIVLWINLLKVVTTYYNFLIIAMKISQYTWQGVKCVFVCLRSCFLWHYLFKWAQTSGSPSSSAGGTRACVFFVCARSPAWLGWWTHCSRWHTIATIQILNKWWGFRYFYEFLKESRHRQRFIIGVLIELKNSFNFINC